LIAALILAAVLAAGSTEAIHQALRSRDFESASAQAEELLRASPDDAEARALDVIALWRQFRNRDAKSQLENLVKRHPDDPWTAYAMAEVHLDDPVKAAAAADKLSGIANDDLVLMRARVARASNREAEALRIIDEAMPHAQDRWRLVIAKASVMIDGAGNDAKRADEALAMFAEARAAEPGLVDAWYLPGTWLQRRRRSAEARPLLERAAALSDDGSVALLYWASIRGSSDLSADVREKEHRDAIDGFMAKRAGSPAAFYWPARGWEAAGNHDEAGKLTVRLIAEFPDSSLTDYANSSRLAKCLTSQDKNELRRCRTEAEAFVARPHQVVETADTVRIGLLAVYRDDPAVSTARLYALVKELQKRPSYPIPGYFEGAMALADRHFHLSEAERMPAEGLRVMFAEISASGDPPDDAAHQRQYVEALARDAIGWVYFRESKLDAAAAELDQAIVLEPRLAAAEYHRGMVAEAKHLPEEAAEHYVAGLPKLSRGRPNPSIAALQRLYRSQHGRANGYDTWVKALQNGEAAKRKQAVLASRPKVLKPAPRFVLQTLDGRKMTNDDLRGHIAVINFWGVWCIHCVAELPEYAALARNYHADRDVLVLTINNDNDPAKVRRWMAANHYDFPILLDDGWLANTGLVTTFPTTWFLDPNGNLAFAKIGETKNLVEEFTWRVEDLKGRTR